MVYSRVFIGSQIEREKINEAKEARVASAALMTSILTQNAAQMTQANERAAAQQEQWMSMLSNLFGNGNNVGPVRVTVVAAGRGGQPREHVAGAYQVYGDAAFNPLNREFVAPRTAARRHDDDDGKWGHEYELHDDDEDNLAVSTYALFMLM